MKARRWLELKVFVGNIVSLRVWGAGLATWNKKRINRWRGEGLLKPLRRHKDGDDGDE